MTGLVWALTAVLAGLWAVALLRLRRPRPEWQAGLANLCDAEGRRLRGGQPVQYRLHMRGGAAWIEVRDLIEYRLPPWADATVPEWQALTVRVWNTATAREVACLPIDMDGPVYPGATLLVRVTP